MLNIEKIEENIKKRGYVSPKIIHYATIDSTNTRAKEYAKDNPENRSPVVFIADEQTAGRGRRGRSFVSRAGAGIYISILDYPDSNGFDATKVTAEAAVNLAKAIESLCPCDIKVKWVNDLYLGGKKLAGILTEGEVDSTGKIAYQVIGMGINVYKNAISDEISAIATSIESEGFVPPDRSDLAAEIITRSLYSNGDPYAEYKARSFIIGKKVRVMKLAESYEAEVIDINPDYSLKIHTSKGEEDLFTGEVSLKI